MKHFTFFCLTISILLVACGTSPASAPTLTVQPVETLTAPEPATVTPTLAPTGTSTAPPVSTVTLTLPAPTLTPSAPETCPQANAKLRPSFSLALKDKKLAYHDARQAVLDFLNAGGAPQTAIAKLAENGVAASQMDLTDDGVLEFLLPSGYFTIFGCKGGKYQTLLDIAPDERTDNAAIPLVIQDLNRDGVPEILLAQALDTSAKYSLLEWDGMEFAPLTPVAYGSQGDSIYIENHDIYTVGQSNAEKGRINGNWGVLDVDGDGLKEIVIKAGVYDSFVWSSGLEQQIVLAWRGAAYVVSTDITESTPTPTPTFTPLPFSAACEYKVSSVRYKLPEDRRDYQQSIEDFLNAGGSPEQLKAFFTTTIQDLTNDGLPDVLLYSDAGNLVRDPSIYVFTCVNGKYQEKLGIDSPTKRFGIGTFQIGVMAIKDNNKNGVPEIFIKDIGCFSFRCGALYVAEWDGNEFKGLIKQKSLYGNDTVDFSEMGEPSDQYLKDMDNDGMAELVWTGGVTPDWNGDHWAFYPQRLETHILKWDGKNYTAQPVEYSAPEYRFQAVQDGDGFALEGKYEQALTSYQLAIKSEGLGWWTEARKDSIIAPHGFGPCAKADPPCPAPVPNPNERPVLSAYAAYRIMLVYLLTGKPNEAKNAYQSLLATYSSTGSSYPLTEMATAFWNEYQSSQNMGNACAKAVAYISGRNDILQIISGAQSGLQNVNYVKNPDATCPFK